MTRAAPVDGDISRARRRGVAAIVDADWVTAPGTPAALARECVETLRLHGVDARAAGRGVDGDALLGFATVDAAMLDAVRSASARGRHRVLAIALAASPSNLDLWHVVRAGATDVLAWKGEGSVPENIVQRLLRWREVDQLLDSDLVRANLIGASAAWRNTLRQAVELARFSTADVLLIGESGTGKELVARLIHTLDARAHKRDLVTVDCTTLAPELIGSELFGHERGAFTGASAPRDGACALAHHGTLFLDEIGDLPLCLQPQLLRVVQERSVKRVGGNAWFSTEFRLVCATHRELEAERDAGRFRADLYYRVAQCTLALPPLRERAEDILPLAEHFAHQRLGNGAPVGMVDAVREHLLRRSYAGNVRELSQVVGRICARHVGSGPITVGDLPPDEQPSAGCSVPADWREASQLEPAIERALALGARLKDLSQYTCEAAIRLAVEKEHGNLQRAAYQLGLTDRALQLRRAQRHHAPAAAGADGTSVHGSALRGGAADGRAADGRAGRIANGRA